MRRVVITGLGAVSPHGIKFSDLWQGLLEGRSSIAPLAQFDPSGFPSQVAGTVPAFKTTDYVPKSYRKATKIMARDIELAVVAADGAVRDARLATRGIMEASGGSAPGPDWHVVDPRRVGCNIGAGLICADLNELGQALAQARNSDGTLSLARWGKSEDPSKTSGMDNLTPLWLLKYLPNMLACHVSIIHDTQGPSNTITCEQASAGLALAEAGRTIQRGQADIALIGGCESMIHPMGLMRWSLLGRVNNTANPAGACRPYDRRAAGTVVAEGGAVLVIEELEHAQKRNAHIYCEIAGLAAACSGRKINDPDPTGESAAFAIAKALRDAGVASTEVQAIVPPGSSVPAHDQSDVAAITRVFGKQADVLLAPARGGLGDCSAGAQAIDLAAAAMALHEQKLWPVAGSDQPLAGVRMLATQQAMPLQNVLVLASSLAGQHSAVVLRKWQ